MEEGDDDEIEVYEEEAINVARVIQFYSSRSSSLETIHDSQKSRSISSPTPSCISSPPRQNNKRRIEERGGKSIRSIIQQRPKRLKCLQETSDVKTELPRHLFSDVSDAMDLCLPCLMECQKFLNHHYNKPKNANPTPKERFTFFSYMMEPSHLDIWRRFHNKFQLSSKDYSSDRFSGPNAVRYDGETPRSPLMLWENDLLFSPCASLHLILDTYEELRTMCHELYDDYPDAPTDTERVHLFKKLMVTFDINPDYRSIRNKWLELKKNEDKLW